MYACVKTLTFNTRTHTDLKGKDRKMYSIQMATKRRAEVTTGVSDKTGTWGKPATGGRKDRCERMRHEMQCVTMLAPAR